MPNHYCPICGDPITSHQERYCVECADLPPESRRAKRQDRNNFERMEARLTDDELRDVERYGRVLDS